MLHSLIAACADGAPHVPACERTRARFMQVRRQTENLIQGLSDADASIQAMPDASPAKWHLAHTTWFFEAFVLRPHFADYALFDSDFHFLFNSYYEAEGPRLARHRRGLLSRPSLAEVLEYRHHVTASICARLEDLPPSALDLIELGCHHEEQHQELLQTDVLYLFGCNPLLPAWRPANAPSLAMEASAAQLDWIRGEQGPCRIGHSGEDFAFDCETPAHTVWLTPHALANRLVNNGEWRAFIEDGAYRNPALWLSDGWAWVNSEGIEAPLYWMKNAQGEWDFEFGIHGKRTLNNAAPVRHISYYEADAYARWCGARLPTEAEWESAVASVATSHSNTGLQQMFGQVWQWTQSAYLPYPGFRAAPGAVGEYNGKFMSGQFVLRGSSCATPHGHARATYRNFFYPHQRWQYTGIRLAQDL